MGCGAGRYSETKKLAEDGRSTVTPDYEKVIWIPRSDKEQKFMLKQNFWSWSGGDYMVKDNAGNDIFKVDGKVMTLRDKMILLAPDSGEKMCMIQEKMLDEKLNDKFTFQIFTYKPNQVSQESTEKDDGVAVYRYASIVQVHWQTGNNWGDQYNLHLYDGNDRKEPALFSAFRETWRWQWDSKVNVFKGDQVKEKDGKLEDCEMVAKFGMFNKDWWANLTDDNNVYGIEMSPHVDPILLVCLCICSDAMQAKENERKKG